MSYDIYVFSFADGLPSAKPCPGLREELLALSAVYEPRHAFARLDLGSGEGTDVYGVPESGASVEGLMFNHTSRAALDLIARIAGRYQLAVVTSEGTAIVTEEQRAHLPADIPVPIALVTSGADLALLIEGA